MKKSITHSTSQETNKLKQKILFFLILLIYISPALQLFAINNETDLLPKVISGPKSEILIGKPAVIQYSIYNQQWEPAPSYTVSVTVRKSGSGINAFSETATGYNLLPQGTHEFTTSTSWTPTSIGDYTITVRVTFSQDIDHSNDVLTRSIRVYTSALENIVPVRFANPDKNRTAVAWFLKINYLNGNSGTNYLNILAKVDKNKPAQWIGQNIILPGNSTTKKFLALVDLNVFSKDSTWKGDSIYVQDKISAGSDVAAYQWVDGYERVLKLSFRDLDVSYGGIQPDTAQNETGQTQVTSASGNFVTYNANTFPFIDLNARQENPVLDSGYAGDKNSDAPAACANSLQWLENLNPNLKSGLDLREKLFAFSKIMKRQNEKGVSDSNFIIGKLRLFDNLKLPVSINFWKKGLTGNIQSADDYIQQATNGGNGSNYPTWNYFNTQVRNNRGVQLWVSWWQKSDSVWQSIGSQVLTVTGVGQGGGIKQFWYKLDTLQSRLGSSGDICARWETFANTGNPYILDNYYKGVQYQGRIEGVVYDTYNPSMIFREKGSFERIFSGNARFFSDAQMNEDTIPNPRMVNVVGRKNGNSPTQWLVKNFPISLNGTNLYEIYLDPTLMGFSEVEGFPTSDIDSIQAKIFYADSIWTYQKVVPANQFFLFTFNKALPRKLPAGSVDTSKFKMKDPYKTFNPVFSGKKMSVTDSASPALDLSVLDLDSAQYNNQFVLWYSGDLGASAPASIANILEWMELHNDKVKTGTPHRSKLYEISNLMNRELDKGALRENVIKGFLNYIDSLRMPLTIKFQSFRLGSEDIPSPMTVFNHKAKNESSPSITPNWNWLKNELKTNGPLALELGFYENSIRKSGTWINCVAFYEQNGTLKLIVKDDAMQDSAGGLRTALVTYDSSASNYPMIVEFSNAKKQCYIETILAITYDSTVNFTKVSEDFSSANTYFSCYPNPSKAETAMILDFFAIQDGIVDISIYDLLGNKIQNIFNGFMEYGINKINWNSKISNGSSLQSGAYIIVLKGEKYRSATKLIKY